MEFEIQLIVTAFPGTGFIFGIISLQRNYLIIPG